MHGQQVSGYMIFSLTGCAGSCIGMEFGNTYVHAFRLTRFKDGLYHH